MRHTGGTSGKPHETVILTAPVAEGFELTRGQDVASYRTVVAATR